MVKNLKRARKLLEKEGRVSDYDFFPQTYVLPLEHGIFVEEFRRNPGETCINKHNARCCTCLTISLAAGHAIHLSP